MSECPVCGPAFIGQCPHVPRTPFDAVRLDGFVATSVVYYAARLLDAPLAKRAEALVRLELAAAHLDAVTELLGHDSGFADEVLGLVVALREEMAAAETAPGALCCPFCAAPFREAPR